MDKLPRIGVLGGGQLGRMLQQVATRWNWPVFCMDKSTDSPAALYSEYFTTGDINSYDDVMAFGGDKDILTVEIEHVNIEALFDLEKAGKEIHPNPTALSLIQNKCKQKDYYKANLIPSSPHFNFDSRLEAIDLFDKGIIKLPCIYKSAELGYDGKGVRLISNRQDIEELPDLPGLFEEKINIKAELALSGCANADGELVFFEPVTMTFDPETHILSDVYCFPGALEKYRPELENIATKLIKGLAIKGLLAVEFFLNQEDQLIVNEIAPRPHNSMHHTIENSTTNQFEQHLRGIGNMPLGLTSTLTSAIMFNIIGRSEKLVEADWPGFRECLNIPGCHIHLYGKKVNKPGRKMGHITLTGNDMTSLKENLKKVKNTFDHE
ncbi:MAG TPA: ATP-grasp domain-containing protein [Saprospiraceae bacterium]|nr:ATP-grasp domain-containing protein [Saprospiraceae bacterium]